MTVSQTLTNCT